MPPSSLTRAGVAPTPPAGPTTYTALTGMVVGVIIAALSLFDVVPSGEDVQALGTITGAALAAIAFVVSAVSRTKQANHLAKIAQAERLRPTLADKVERVTVTTAPATAPLVFTRPDGEPAMGYTDPKNVREGTAGSVAGVSLPSSEEVLGAPTDLSREVQFGSVRPPGVDVGGEAPVVIDSGYSDLTQGANT